MLWNKELNSIKQIKPGDIVYSFNVEYAYVFLGCIMPVSWRYYHRVASHSDNYSFEESYYYEAKSEGKMVLYLVFDFNAKTEDMLKVYAKKSLENFREENVVACQTEDFCRQA